MECNCFRIVSGQSDVKTNRTLMFFGIGVGISLTCRDLYNGGPVISLVYFVIPASINYEINNKYSKIFTIRPVLPKRHRNITRDGNQINQFNRFFISFFFNPIF